MINFGLGTAFRWTDPDGSTDFHHITSWEWSGGQADETEVTNIGSPVYGTGADARVLRSYDCTSIEPMVLTVDFYGAPPITGVHQKGGQLGIIAFSVPLGTGIYTYSAHAALIAWRWRCDSFDSLQMGTATFKFTEIA